MSIQQIIAEYPETRLQCKVAYYVRGRQYDKDMGWQDRHHILDANVGIHFGDKDRAILAVALWLRAGEFEGFPVFVERINFDTKTLEDVSGDVAKTLANYIYDNDDKNPHPGLEVFLYSLGFEGDEHGNYYQTSDEEARENEQASHGDYAADIRREL